MRSFPILLASACLLAVMPDCATLPTLGVCGNGLVDEAEDCDGQAGLAANVHCAAANQQNACRYTCKPGDSMNACPAGYFCSPVDGICRANDGQFGRLSSSGLQADHMAIADFDGNGIADLFTSLGPAGASQANVYFFGAAGVVAAKTSVPPVGFGAGAPLTGKSAADLVGFLPNGVADTGMLVLQGDASRSLLPASFSSFPLGKEAVTFLPPAANSEVLALRGGKIVTYSVTGGVYAFRGQVTPHLPWGRSGYLGDGAKAGLRLGLANAHDVDIYDFDVPFGKPRKVTAVLADPSRIIQDFWFTRYDNDLLLDLVVVTDCPGKFSMGCQKVFVAYGTPDGSKLAPSPGATGSSTPTAVDANFVAPPFIPDGFRTIGPIVGFANLLGGTTGEAICQGGIVSSSAVIGNPWETKFNFIGTASEVAIADFNRDGVLDLVVADDGMPELEYVLNAGLGRFNSTLVPLGGPAKHLAVGDFDGDLYPDAAFAEEIDAKTAKVGFAFGGPGALPAGPLEIGPLGPISQVVVGVNILGSAGSGATARTDLLTVAGKGTEARLAVFPGSAIRELYSPWFFVPKGSTYPQAPSSAAIGAFSGGANQLAAIVTTTPPGLFVLEATNGTLAEAGSPIALPMDMDTNSTVALTMPRPSGGTDDLAVIARTNDTTPHGALAFLRTSGGRFGTPPSNPPFDPPPLMFDNSQYVFLQGGGAPGSGSSSSPPFPRLPVCAIDLDGDKATDLAFVGDELPHSLRIAWQDHGDLGTPVAILKKEHVAPDWIACIQTSSGTQIAVLDGGNVYLVQCGGSYHRTCSKGANVAHPGGSAVYGSGASGSGMVIPLSGSGGGNIGAASSTTIPMLLAGDLTGDGLEDLVVTGFGQGVEIFNAKATIP